MKLFMEKSATSRVMTGVIGLAMAVSLASCSNEAEEAPDIVVTPDTPQPEQPAQTEYIPASADGPAQNVPEPTLPAIATEETEEGAESALEFFWQAIDFARMTGDTQPLQLVSHETCELCVAYMDRWSLIYEQDDWAHLHGEIELNLIATNRHFDEVHEEEWVEIVFDLREPAADMYINGNLDEKSSSEEENVARWIADLSFDGSSQRWFLEWAGVEENDQGPEA